MSTAAANCMHEVVTLGARMHAATARFVDAATSFDDTGEWGDMGMRSGAHWLSVATGVDLWCAREMLRVGHALPALPRLHAAFADGRISLDKVRAITRVATGADEGVWLGLATEASASQLSRICREFGRTIAVDDPRRAEKQRARRRLVSWWLDDEGMLALYATLPPEEGRLVLNAVEAAVARRLPEDDCAEHPHGARRADALVRICERWLDGAAAAGSAAPAMVVHVDAKVLESVVEDGRCHLEGGPAIPVAAARRIGCDADVVTVVERDGVPVGVGRSRRLVSGRMRRLLHLRDGGCRYPGCDVPAAGTEGHHVVHWADGGETRLENLVSLCRFHHHRHHEGAFRIAVVGSPGGSGVRFRFETAHGVVMGRPGAEAVVTEAGASASQPSGP